MGSNGGGSQREKEEEEGRIERPTESGAIAVILKRIKTKPSQIRGN